MHSATCSLVLLSLASSILAKTDLAGCTSTRTLVGTVTSVLWYVPNSGEICSILDCGGGQAPPKTNVPGCAAYEGSAAYSASFLSGFGPPATLTSTGPVPTGLLTDTSKPVPASTLITIASTAPVAETTTTLTPASTTPLVETTTTLALESTASLVTSSLIFDTSIGSSPVSNMITVTSSQPTSVSTANAAPNSNQGNHFAVAAVGALAAFAML